MATLTYSDAKAARKFGAAELTLFNLEGTLIDSNGLWTEHLSSDSHFCTLKTEQRKTKKSKATEGATLVKSVATANKCGTFRVTQQ